MSKKKISKEVKAEIIKPLSDYVFVEVDESREISEGGIILPESVRKSDTDEAKVRFGTVVASGPGLRLDSGEVQPTELRSGDRVIIDVDSGEEVKHGGKTLVAIREQNVLAVIE